MFFKKELTIAKLGEEVLRKEAKEVLDINSKEYKKITEKGFKVTKRGNKLPL